MIDISLLPKNIFTVNSQILQTSFASISTDTRKVQKNDLFVALKGENFDAFNFLEAAIEKGAKAVAFSQDDNKVTKIEELKCKFPETTFIETNDALIFLQDLARSHLKWWKSLKNKKVVVLTGSNGKTTNKEILKQFFESILSAKVLATQGNLNNHIGLPLTILRLENFHELAIFEIGTNHPGEIKFLSEMSLADFCYITNIGDSHLEFFGSRENVFKEKSELYYFTKKYSSEPFYYLCNTDDELLKSYQHDPSVITVSTKEKNADFFFDFKSAQSISMFKKGHSEEVHLNNSFIFERHNKLNLCLCLTVALTLFPNKESEILNAFTSIKLPANNRSNLIKRDDQIIYLDAYNANPSSMKASISSFLSYLKDEKHSIDECLFVIGDMNELGDKAQELHRDLGLFIQELGIHKLHFVGRYVNYFKEGYKLPFNASPSVKEIDKTKLLKSSKIIYLKGSRSIELETLVL